MNELDYYKARKSVKKLDVILMFVGFLLIFASFFLYLPAKGATVSIYRDGVLSGQYTLSENRRIALETCTVVIEDGAVYVSESDCENQICVLSGTISEAHQVIVCAPNRIVIAIEKQSGADAVTGGAR